MKLGRNRPAIVPHNCRVHIDQFIASDLPVPPMVEHLAPLAYQGETPVYKNDTLGCCVISGAEHIENIWRGNAGSAPPWATDADVLALYEAIGNYNPSNPATDRGCDEVTALNYFKNTGILNNGAPHKIVGWASVDGSNPLRCKQALYLFENLYFGVELPDAWINPMPSASGFVWDAAGAPNPNYGHCFVGVGYNDNGVMINTWGLIGTLTWAAVAKYATTAGSGELYTMLSADSLERASQKAPNGFDILGLQTALAAY